MKIAVMMRAIDAGQGFLNYICKVVEKMIKIAPDNEYLLFYYTDKYFGKFAGEKNVTEMLFGPRNKLLWDQVSVPYHAWKQKADIILNLKFSVPLISHCPVAMGLQEPAWWKFPEHHEWWDVLYMQTMLPLYVRKAAHIFPMSEFILTENKKYINYSFPSATVAYAMQNDYFRPIEDKTILVEMRRKYSMPSKFILSVTRVLHTGFDKPTYCPTKNLDAAVRAFNLIRDEIEEDLVVIGKKARDYLTYRGFRKSEIDRVHFYDLVPNEDIPYFHNSSTLFVLPSLYEGCPGTLLEAMACGDAIVASSAGPMPEIAGDAALFADPYRPEEFAEKIMMILGDSDLRKGLGRKSLERSKFFSGEQTARIILDGLYNAFER